MSAWALPLWLNIEILAVAQFPWRLLSILSLPLALFTGGIVLTVPSGRLQIVAAAGVVSILILAQQPRLMWMDVYSPETVNVSASAFAQTEVEKGTLGGGEGNSSIQEFRPKWADRTLKLTGETPPAEVTLDVKVLSGNRWATTLATDADEPFLLRFTDFYYPGWRVLLDGGEELEPYPSTNLGLRTVDIPAGSHAVSIEWTGTRVQRYAAFMSLAALALAAVLGWKQQTKFLAAGLALAMVLGFAGMLSMPEQQPAETPSEALDTGSLQLLGYRTAGPVDGQLTVYPYWYVRRRLEEDVHFRWTLVDSDGDITAETVALPFYNTYGAENWPAATLVDDAVVLNLPAGMAAGVYRLVASVERPGEGVPLAKGTVGDLHLDGVSGKLTVAESELDVRFGESVRLAGYEILSPRRDRMAGRDTPVLQAGEYLRILLYWTGAEPVPINYHSFVHLVDHLRRPLVQEDQLPGPLFQPPRLWDRFTLWPDAYLLRLPETTESGLYWPAVGMYEYEAEDRLPVFIGDGVADDASDAAREDNRRSGAETGAKAEFCSR